MRRSISRALNLFDKFEFWLGIIASGTIVVMALLTVYEVIMRYFLNAPSRWVLPSTQYIIIYLAYLPAAYLLRQNRHVTVDILLEAVPQKAKMVMMVASSFIGLAVCLVLTWLTFDQAWYSFKFGLHFTEGLDIPQYWVFGVIPFGFLLLSLQWVREIQKNVVLLRRTWQKASP